MKKDTYPDIRIEVHSEGLAKKILGKVEDSPPSVYGEEKPTSTTIPDINAKGVNREMAEILETSNKKPSYTAIVKEVVQELRKDNKSKIKVDYSPPYSHEYQDIGSREIAGVKTVSIDPNTDKEQKFEGERMPQRPDASQNYKGDTQKLLTEGGFGRSVSEDFKAGGKYTSDSLPVIAAGKVRDKQISSTLTPEQRKKGAASIGSGRLEEAMVKEAIQELRKAPEGQYGQFQPGGVPKKTRDEAAAKRIDATIGATSPESRKLQSAPTTESTKYGTELTGEIAGVPQKKTTTETVENVRGTMTGTPDETAPGMPGTAVQRLYSVEPTPKIDDFSTDYSMGPSAARSKDPGIDYGSITGMGAPTRAATSAEVAAREKGTKDGTDLIDPNTAEMFQDYDKVTGRSDIDEDALEGRSSSADLDADEMFQDFPTPEEGGEKEIKPDGGPTDDGPDGGPVDSATAGATGAETKTGISHTDVTDELDKIDAGFKPQTLSRETLRPQGSGGQLLPEYGSSGYNSAVLQIGEGKTIERDGKQVTLASVNYGVKDLEDFLSLYAQNETFNRAKFEENLGIESTDTKSIIKGIVSTFIHKQAPMMGGAAGQLPKTTSMTKPANMGVGQQQPVVSGAGVLKAKINKEPAPAAKRKTSNRPRKNIEEAIVKAVEQALEKAPKRGRNLPSKARQFSQTEQTPKTSADISDLAVGFRNLKG